jgi:uncharacterized membrane protein YdbT with pleckstrin-like domain
MESAMGYVVQNLGSNEEVVRFAKVHWFVFVPGFVMVVIAIALARANPGDASDGAAVLGIASAVLLIVGIAKLIGAAVQKMTTELALTTRRVIAKEGLIRRNTIELSHSKVESLIVDQSIPGRIFGYGTIVVNGTGGGKTPIPNIAQPLAFRRAAMDLMDDA